MSAKKLNCLFVVASMEPGGLELYLLRFLQHYSNEINAKILCKSGKTGELESSLRAMKVGVIAIKMGYVNPISLFSYYKLITNNNFDAICDFTGSFAGFSMLLSYLAKIKKRVVFYRLSTNHFKETILNSMYHKTVKKIAYTFSTDLLFNSISGVRFFFKQQQNNSKIKVIRNGINIESLTNPSPKKRSDILPQIPRGGFIVGHVGRYNKAKNHGTILKVAKEVIGKKENIYFVLIGKGTEELNSQLTVKEQKRIISLGYKSNVADYVRHFNLFFFPSITEGQPNALIEAMVCGVPILSSNINPVNETVPREFRKHLKDPMDVEGYIKEILLLKKNKKELRQRTCAKFAKINYDGTNRYQEFFDVLAK